MTLIIKSTIVAASLALALPVWSQVPVVDLSDNEQPAEQMPTYPQLASRAQTNPQAEAYYQMQMLQREVQELRGNVEELKYEVKRLRQQRSEDYMDLDRRILRMSNETPSTAVPSSTIEPSESAAAETRSNAEEAERDRYQASFALAREGDYAGARKGFEDLLKDYPKGTFAPNANYWLGEIALVQGNVEEARKWFVALLEGYPDSSKVWDGRYKLGTVYHQLGEQEKAQALLQQVADSNARAAKLARRYLQENF